MNTITLDNDKTELIALVGAAQRGDRQAFGDLFERFERHVMAIALRRLNDYGEAQELCQDVFIQAMKKVRQLREPEAFAAIQKLRPGQHTGILNVVDPNTKKLAGFRVIRLLEREPAGQRQLQDPAVQQFIREQLRGSREQLLKAAYYEVVRDESKVENYYAQDILKNTAK